MKRSVFSLLRYKEAFLPLIDGVSQQTLAVWSRDCAARVLPYFEQARPDDPRPRQALETLQTWIDSGVFKMAVIRKASLDAHAAAREVGADNVARSAARAAGQAVATAHVPMHAIGGAIYALQAIYRLGDPAEVDAAIAQEQDWQVRHLIELREGRGETQFRPYTKQLG